ncbi:SMI1/KNR4 family protein [Stenotrophomonas rhizophila]|uniref:SMI1/KNR4 family protein n=1 Tax=Stenotrophomonas rhizophila TaxID=216778 RepID=UPI0028D886AC|nr:SMI1/KNR4 family protein [Stenotrophomonas rhizophila]
MWTKLLNDMNVEGLKNIQLARNEPIEDLGLTSFIQKFPNSPLAQLASRVGKEDIRWLGQKGASPEQIRTAEARLGVRFPDSYRQFLLASNGFLIPGSFCCVLLPVDLVRRFGDDNPDIVELWNALLEEDPNLADEDDFACRIGDTIQISEGPLDYDLFALLDTASTSPEGEAWTIMHNRQGYNEYETFAKLAEEIGRPKQPVVE